VEKEGGGGGGGGGVIVGENGGLDRGRAWRFVWRISLLKGVALWISASLGLAYGDNRSVLIEVVFSCLSPSFRPSSRWLHRLS